MNSFPRGSAASHANRLRTGPSWQVTRPAQTCLTRPWLRLRLPVHLMYASLSPGRSTTFMLPSHKKTDIGSYKETFSFYVEPKI